MQNYEIIKFRKIDILIDTLGNLLFPLERKIHIIQYSLGLIGTLYTIIALHYTLNISFSLKNVFYIMLLIVLPSLISYYFFPVWVGIFISFITICVVFFYITRTTKALYHVLLLIIGQMISYSLTKIFMLPIELNAFAWLEHVFMILLNVIFVYIFFKRLNKGIEFTNFTMNMQLFIFFILCSSFMVFLINIFFSTLMVDSFWIYVYFFTQFLYLVILLTVLYLLQRQFHKNQHLKMEMVKQNQLSNYIVALETINEDMKHFRHDYANILFTLQTFIETEDIQGLKHYFQSRILKVEQQTLLTNKAFCQIKNLKLMELKGLIASKLLIAEQLGINVHLEIPEEVHTAPADMIDLSRIIGILIDNAIEASEKASTKQIQIGFIQTPSSMLIVIKNTFDEMPDMNLLYKGYYSTKGEGRGIGLVNVRKLLHKYPNATMNTRIENGWFIQELEFR